MPECELCGNDVASLKKYKIEGAEVLACNSCGKFGILIEEPTTPKTSTKIAFRGGESSIMSKPKSIPPPQTIPPSIPTKKNREEEELKEDYCEIIRHAREKLGLTRKELAESIFIRESMLARIETGKLVPDNDVKQKLEKTLEISLMVSTQDAANAAQYAQKNEPKSMRTLTLGDFAHIKKKKSI